jgi:hypothetical protein
VAPRVSYLLHTVSDEGGYWEKRDVKALVEEVTEWNAMMAGFVGQMKDFRGEEAGREIQSEINRFPNYEHLEAKGRVDEDQVGERDELA